MTTVPAAPEPCFAWVQQHGGPVVTWADASRHHDVEGAGLDGWWAHSFHDDRPHNALNKHREQAGCLLSLELYPAFTANGEPLRWGSTLKVGEGRYVRAGGSAASFSEALSQCQAHEHQSRQIGSLTWWRESEDRWTSWLGPFTLKAMKISRAGAESCWHYQVDGDASSLEEAALLASLGRMPVAGASGT